VSSNAVNGAAPPIETCTVPTLLPLGSITIVTGIVVTAAGASTEGSAAVSGTTLCASSAPPWVALQPTATTTASFHMSLRPTSVGEG